MPTADIYHKFVWQFLYFPTYYRTINWRLLAFWHYRHSNGHTLRLQKKPVRKLILCGAVIHWNLAGSFLNNYHGDPNETNRYSSNVAVLSCKISVTNYSEEPIKLAKCEQFSYEDIFESPRWFNKFTLVLGKECIYLTGPVVADM